MFITPAFAEATTETAVEAAAGGGSLLLSMLPIFLILAVFYFLVIRPQNKRLHEHRDMVSNLQKGDRVVTGGGIVATVKKTGGDDEVVLEVAFFQYNLCSQYQADFHFHLKVQFQKI